MVNVKFYGWYCWGEVQVVVVSDVVSGVLCCMVLSVI